jgi:formate hydrogenlyase subunit 6/NADH:ubiquinone oxidoreductase subunit I
MEKAMQAKIAADAARDRAAAEKSMRAAIHGGVDPETATEMDYDNDTPIDWCVPCMACSRFICPTLLL